MEQNLQVEQNLILRDYPRIKKGGKHPPGIESIISKEIGPVRSSRINSRKI